MSRSTALNAYRMKAKNQRRILQELRFSPISRSELARRTGLTRSAISLMVDSLLGANILVVGDTISSKSVGRSSTPLYWNKDAYYSIGISLRRRGITIGMTDFLGNLIAVNEIDPTSFKDTQQAMLMRIDDVIRNFFKKATPNGQFLGIGISSPGPFDDAGGTILNPPNFELFHGAPIVEHFTSQFGCEVVLENDANARALAELCYGIKNRYKTFLVLDIATGIGSGYIDDGRLNKGVFGHGFEFGHLSIDINGRRCVCGNIGCAETFASIPSIVTEAKLLDKRLNSWEAIIEYSNNNNSSANLILRKEANYLATIIVNAVNILDIEAVILTGQITYHSNVIVDLIQQEVDARIFSRLARSVKVLSSQIPQNKHVLSGANLMIENFLDSLETASQAI